MLSTPKWSTTGGAVRYQPEEERSVDAVLDVHQARRFLGISDEDLASLVQGDAALPTVPGGYAYHDLVSTALDLHLPRSVPELGLRMMMRFAERGQEGMSGAARWSFLLRPPATWPEDTGELVLREPTEARLTTILDLPRAAQDDGWALTAGADLDVQGQLETIGVPYRIKGEAATEVYDGMLAAFREGAVRFQWIGAAGRAAYDRTWRSGRADCVVVSRVAADVLRRRGVRVRSQGGRVLGILDARHTWIDVQEDGTWKRFDPLLQTHCERLWGGGDDRGEFFRGGIPSALPGWPGEESMVVWRSGRRQENVDTLFSARRISA